MEQHSPLAAARTVHLVGIGGAAMTPLATILLQRGVHVTGSDVIPASASGTLERLGARLFVGHEAEQVGNADLVVVSAAIPLDNPEIQAAQFRGIPVIKHSEALGQMMRQKRGVAIAGTHGKTTTTALTAFVLDSAGMDPTFHVGSELLNYGLFGRHGQGDVLVAEADEFDRRFLDYEPEIAVVTSVEPDHLDYFGTFHRLVEAFEAFVTRIRPGGALIVSADDAHSRGLTAPQADRLTYGFAADADWRVLNWEPLDHSGSSFTLRAPDGNLTWVSTRMCGLHNAANAAAAIAAAHRLGVPAGTAGTALSEFKGTRRRFETVGTARGITIVDDYAHHPTAIRATLAAARAHYRSTIWAVFQPHTAHRTVSLFDDFLECFADADHVLIAPTYRPPGREPAQILPAQIFVEADDPSVAALVRAMKHRDARKVTLHGAVDAIVDSAREGDLVLVMGAGDICTIEPAILSGLEGKETGHDTR